LHNVHHCAWHAAHSGETGHIDFTFDSKAEINDFTILPDGKVDYRSTCRITMTEKRRPSGNGYRAGNRIAGMRRFRQRSSRLGGEPARLTAGTG